MEKNLFAEAEPQLGKLRTFLLTAFQRFLRDVHDHDHARKRGGGEVLALDISTGEDCFAREPADPATPEKTFARHWALAVLRAALAALAEEEARAGRTAPFRALEPFLSPDSAAEPDYADAARQLGVSEDAARQSVSRLRKKFRETLRGQIADTLHDPSAEHIAEELASLRAALRG